MSAVEDILRNVDEQVAIYQRLLDLSVAQLEAVQRQDVRTVHALLQEIEQAMIERGRIDQRRTTCVTGVALELGIGVEEVTASRLEAATGDPAVAQRIRTGSAKLGELVPALDRVVEINRALLEHELEVIDHLVHGLVKPREAQPTYARTGAQHEAGTRLRLLDMQA